MAFFDRFLQPGRTARKPVAPAPQMSVPKPVYGPQAPTMSVAPKPYQGIPGTRDMFSRFSDGPAKTQNFGGLLGKIAPQAFGGNSNLSTTSYGQNTLKQPSNPFSRPSVVGPSGQAMSSVPQMSVAPPKSQMSLEQLRAMNEPARQALQQSQGRTQGQVQASSGPVVQPAPKLPPPPSQGAYGGSLNPSDPAFVGGQMNQTLGTQIPNQPKPELPPPSSQNLRTEFTPQAPSQLDILRRQYLDSLGLSPEEQAAQAELSGISGTAASESARAKQEYADRIKAIQDQATLQPFLTGRQIQASGQLNNQLDAITSATEAQTMPLQQRLAMMQASRQAAQERSKTELGFAQSDREAEQVTPVEVGGRLVNPRTGAVVYSPPAEAAELLTLSPNETVYDRATGKALYTAPAAPSSTGFGDAPTVKEINGTTYQWNPVSSKWEVPDGATGAGTNNAAVETLNGKLQLIDDLMTSPGMRGSVGPYGVARWTPFSADAAARQDFAAGVNQLISKDTMDVLLNLKKQGGTLGALSDQERILLQSAASKVGTWMVRDKNGNPTGKFAISEDLFKKELQTIRDLTQSALQRAGGGGGSPGQGDELDQVLDSLGFDPVGGVTNNAGLKELTIGKRTVRVAPSIALRLAKAAKDFKQATGRDVQINQDFRSHEEQARLYKELSAKGARVAPPGRSFHEKGMAIDVTNWREFEPFARRYGLVNDLADDRGHFSYLETNRRA